MSDPNFYSGPAEGLNLGYKRILASIDPAHANDAQPQEMFRKVMQDSIRSNIQAMAASGVGRIMLAEVRIIEKSNANPEHTPATNRSLVEITKRTNELNRGVAQLAENYNGGRLDPKFDSAVHEYVKAHPMFSKEEMADPKLLGAPIAPAGINSPQAAADWAKKMQLQKGDAIRLPNGQYRYVP